MSADQTSPSFCFPSTHGITASSLSSCSSPIHELNQHLCYGLFLPLLCSTMTFQVLTAVTGVLSILSQHCTVKCLFGNSKFQADEFNSPVPMELEMLGQYLTEQIWRPHWTRLQLNPGWTDRQSQLQKLKPGKPTQMPAYLTYLLECPLGKIPWYDTTLNTSHVKVSALCS